jgi:hypothetical protein
MSDNKQVVERDNLAPAVTSETGAIMAMIERVAMSPDADIEKLERMLQMQERVLDRNAKQAFTADLAAMQAELPLVGKAGRGHNQAKYAKLEDINEAIRPTLQKYGFAVTFRTTQSDKSVTITARLSHKMGFSEETDLTLPLDTSGSKNAVQAVGSTVSYAKRYAICALLNISTGDDTDGKLPDQGQQTLTNQQIDSLRKAMAIAGVTDQEFCNHKSIKINRVEELPQARLAGAIAMLQKYAGAAQ